jgi:NAD(P)-dependent dehydrogenase (short-subunit alcohol dehydrogenase family)
MSGKRTKRVAQLTAARELEPYGIRVHIASPGGMRTNIARSSTGPLADGSRDRGDDWEDPAIVARDIFDSMQMGAVVFHPGYVGRQQGSQPAPE